MFNICRTQFVFQTRRQSQMNQADFKILPTYEPKTITLVFLVSLLINQKQLHISSWRFSNIRYQKTSNAFIPLPGWKMNCLFTRFMHIMQYPWQVSFEYNEQCCWKGPSEDLHVSHQVLLRANSKYLGEKRLTSTQPSPCSGQLQRKECLDHNTPRTST